MSGTCVYYTFETNNNKKHNLRTKEILISHQSEGEVNNINIHQNKWEYLHSSAFL